jgi:hypothetical protein
LFTSGVLDGNFWVTLNKVAPHNSPAVKTAHKGKTYLLESLDAIRIYVLLMKVSDKSDANAI